ncbi:hypothetical protein NA56DRAFT_709481 [Hyaloscypha hepaticicola]|uniref:Uncharacterized protein n=1 Tax=Hyaloscypha hepaticicola TaxID=2082293 RepID=A0A2J6PP79_9HELO|nr:hypothetical protein NA56DRAFT_709481 [Hyaloscypha hepaticicola]
MNLSRVAACTKEPICISRFVKKNVQTREGTEKEVMLSDIRLSRFCTEHANLASKGEGLLIACHNLLPSNSSSQSCQKHRCRGTEKSGRTKSGRNFASVEIKMIFVHLLMRYDLKLVDGDTKPRDYEFEGKLLPNREKKIMIRNRQAF